MLFEALLALAFFAAAVPCGYMTRRVKRSNLDVVRKWSLALGVIHTPVLPLIVLGRLDVISLELELVLAGVIILGHGAGLLVHRQRHGVKAKARTPAPVQD